MCNVVSCNIRCVAPLHGKLNMSLRPREPQRKTERSKTLEDVLLVGVKHQLSVEARPQRNKEEKTSPVKTSSKTSSTKKFREETDPSKRKYEAIVAAALSQQREFDLMGVVEELTDFATFMKDSNAYEASALTTVMCINCILEAANVLETTDVLEFNNLARIYIAWLSSGDEVSELKNVLLGRRDVAGIAGFLDDTRGQKKLSVFQDPSTTQLVFEHLKNMAAFNDAFKTSSLADFGNLIFGLITNVFTLLVHIMDTYVPDEWKNMLGFGVLNELRTVYNTTESASGWLSYLMKQTGIKSNLADTQVVAMGSEFAERVVRGAAALLEAMQEELPVLKNPLLAFKTPIRANTSSSGFFRSLVSFAWRQNLLVSPQARIALYLVGASLRVFIKAVDNRLECYKEFAKLNNSQAASRWTTELLKWNKLAFNWKQQKHDAKLARNERIESSKALRALLKESKKEESNFKQANKNVTRLENKLKKGLDVENVENQLSNAVNEKRQAEQRKQDVERRVAIQRELHEGNKKTEKIKKDELSEAINEIKTSREKLRNILKTCVQDWAKAHKGLKEKLKKMPTARPFETLGLLTRSVFGTLSYTNMIPNALEPFVAPLQDATKYATYEFEFRKWKADTIKYVDTINTYIELLQGQQRKFRKKLCGSEDGVHQNCAIPRIEDGPTWEKDVDQDVDQDVDIDKLFERWNQKAEKLPGGMPENDESSGGMSENDESSGGMSEDDESSGGMSEDDGSSDGMSEG